MIRLVLFSSDVKLLALLSSAVKPEYQVVLESRKEHLKDAIAQGAQLYLTGEIPHHEALAAAKAGITVVATLHSNSERGSLKRFRDRLARATRAVPFLISSVDRDPFQIL